MQGLRRLAAAAIGVSMAVLAVGMAVTASASAPAPTGAAVSTGTPANAWMPGTRQAGPGHLRLLRRTQKKLTGSPRAGAAIAPSHMTRRPRTTRADRPALTATPS